MGVDARTRVAAVIGDPVGHSRSPAIMNAAFAALGLDWVYVAFPVRAGDGAAAVDAMRALGIAGLSVTMPHKAVVMEACDSLTDTARRLGAVNCIAWEGDALVGHNTDGEGLIASLRAEGFEPEGARVVVLGAGGAARASVLALGQAGASKVVVCNRSLDRARDTADLSSCAGAAELSSDVGIMTDLLADADLLVNATPVGMGAGDDSPVPGDALHRDLVVSDLIYHPAQTSLMRHAAAAGAPTHNGLGMLVGQAGAALRIWTGEDPPLEIMAEAARGVVAT